KHFGSVLPVGPAEADTGRYRMLTASQSQRVVYRRNVMATGNVLLVDEGDSKPAGRSPQSRIDASIGERQGLADAQRYAFESIIGTISRGRVRVSAVLDAVAEFVQHRRRQCGLKRAGPHEVAEAEGIGPADSRHRDAPLTGLPVVPVVPRKGDLLFGR